MPTVILGIDPGANGAMVALQEGKLLCHNNKDDDQGCWQWISQWIEVDTFAVIETQTPRPTFVPSLGKATILASTCQLYGNYHALRTMLICANISFEGCPPKQWQKALSLGSRIKGQSDNQWKNVLKSAAIAMFPDVKVTLANADALLIAAYGSLKYANHS